MAGTDNLTPQVIGHIEQVRWMTATIFKEWVRIIDVEMGMRRKKIVLLLDNCMAHPHDIPLDNIRLVFLPANTRLHRRPTNEDLCQEVREARGSTSTHDESPGDGKDLPPPPSSASVDRTLDLLRCWMQFHTYKDYNKYVKLEGSIHNFCLTKRNETTITDLSRQPTK
ncbi:Pyruvate decarboxylase 2 [Branchiostoma belcheri]|nr:Pyruvate decarboxylase 2 [Branchiostoma belcheri]